MYFGVSIGSQGSANIGGLISTNAGGVRVLRYGMMEAQVLGLEVVMADGSIQSSMDGLQKDNRGPDPLRLMIGAEGSLGIITRACLRSYHASVIQLQLGWGVPLSKQRWIFCD